MSHFQYFGLIVTKAVKMMCESDENGVYLWSESTLKQGMNKKFPDITSRNNNE